MRSRLQFRLLGELNVARDGSSVPLPASRKTRALLAYLAVVGRPIRRDHLCEMFWEIPSDPRASLRWSLHKIRRITNCDGQDRLSADGTRVFLDTSTVDVDFLAVFRLRPEDLQELSTPALESLADQFTGEFIEDLSLPHCPKFEAWRVYHRDGASRTRVRILRVLMERMHDRPQQAAYYAHLLQSLDPICDVAPEQGRDTVAVAHGDASTGAPSTPYSPSHTAHLDDRVRDTVSYSGAADSASSRPTPGRALVRWPQDIRFCSSRDGVQIAYAVCGQGPPLVRAAHWMSHVEYDQESPVWRHWIEALSATSTLIRYDQRGNGLSDRTVVNLGFEAMVDDLETVVNAAQLERFTLLGVSQSCAVSAAYAVRHPQRLTGLILYGGFVKGWRKRGEAHEITTHEAMTSLIRAGWGADTPAFRQLFTMMFIPDGDQEQISWFNELQRVTVSPDHASRLHETFGDIDVSSILTDITVPTLVLHASGDLVVPFQSGRAFATGIRGARFVQLDSANHILLADEPAFSKFCREVRRFVAELAAR
jgi:pimeloyl-ACP methyl ester carboxylesterase